ncbi:MAG: ABC transporter ATP-binding protein [candidate division NC10 bacterium]
MVDGSNVIEYDRVRKVYLHGKASLLAVDDMSFAVRDQEFVSILGPSGCGKTTLLKITSGIMPVSGGTVSVNGRPVTEPVSDLGMVFQNPVLVKWRTVMDNVLFPVEILRHRRRDYLDRALDLIRLVGLGGFEDRLPGELSGGMQQRVSICRALITDPPLLLMDEPFGALDALTREDMNLELLRIWEARKKTVLFVTHSIPEAVFLSDKVIVLSPRPSRVARIFEIALPRSREFSVCYTKEFGEYCGAIRAEIKR